MDYIGGRVIEAILTVVWTPNDADNGIKVLTMDSISGGAPVNPTDLKEFTGLTSATPIASTDFVDLATTFDRAVGSGSRYVGFQFKTDAAVAPVLYWVGIMYTVEV